MSPAPNLPETVPPRCWWGCLLLTPPYLVLLPCSQDAIKGLLPGLMLSTPPLVQAQLSEALAIVCGHDFPRQVRFEFKTTQDLNTCLEEAGALGGG